MVIRMGNPGGNPASGTNPGIRESGAFGWAFKERRATVLADSKKGDTLCVSRPCVRRGWVGRGHAKVLAVAKLSHP